MHRAHLYRGRTLCSPRVVPFLRWFCHLSMLCFASVLWLGHDQFVYLPSLFFVKNPLICYQRPIVFHKTDKVLTPFLYDWNISLWVKDVRFRKCLIVEFINNGDVIFKHAYVSPHLSYTIRVYQMLVVPFVFSNRVPACSLDVVNGHWHNLVNEPIKFHISKTGVNIALHVLLANGIFVVL